MTENSRLILNAIQSRTSVRKFLGKKVEQELVEELLKTGFSAPSSKNQQPWEFIVVEERQTLDALAEKMTYAKMLKETPLAIVVLGNPEISYAWQQDCSAAAENILLAAHAMGLGAVWTACIDHGDPLDTRAQSVREILGVPAHIEPMCIIAIGYSAESPTIKNKYREDKIHRNQW